MVFAADFIIEGNDAYTNEKVQFISLDEDQNGNPLGIGVIPDSNITNPDFEIDGPVTIDQVTDTDVYGNKTFKSGYDFVTTVTKKEWRTADGSFFSGDSLIYTFADSGDTTVTYTIYSEYYNLNGKIFRYKLSEVKEVRIYSMFYKLIVENYPMYEKVNNTELQDMFYSFSRLFDRMYEDTKGVFNNIDVQNLSPELLQYMAVTLGHTEDYAKKVGSDIANPNFEDYDIYERIKSGDATVEEISNFRRFLLFSADLFKKKGTPADLIALLKFYHMNATIQELWTASWGVRPYGITTDNFAGLEKFTDNAFGFRWLDMRVIGNDNDEGHFKHKFRSFEVDSYHESQKIEYPSDLYDTLDNGWYEFKILYRPEFVGDVRRENGETFVDASLNDDVKYWDIVTRNGEYFLQIDNTVLDYGDRVSVNYTSSENDISDSLVAQDSLIAKDLDFETQFIFHDITEYEKNQNSRLPENEVFITLRGIKSEDDLYANFNDYYRVGINTRRNTFSVSRVFENNQNKSIVIQNINLSGDTNNPVWEGLIVDEAGERYPFRTEVLYDVLVSLVGSKISVSFREAANDQTIQQNIESDTGGNLYGTENGPWKCLVSNLDLDVNQASVLSLDQNGDEVISVKYIYNDNSGYYGIGSRASILDVNKLTVNNLDLDDTLYNIIDKELYIKPKYLNWQSDELVFYNSYENDTNSFTQVIDDEFNPSVREYLISDQLSKSLQFLYFDEAEVSEIIGSRYTVTFDKDWVSENFDTAQEVMEKMIIPVGSQSGWFLPECRIQNKKFYKNALGGDDESITVATTGSTGTEPETYNVPGFFNFNTNPILSDYETEPYDSFSFLLRSDKGFGEDLFLSEKMKEYRASDEKIFIKGTYEEVSPLSTYWPEYDGPLNLKDGTTYSNRVLFPIVIDSPNYNRFVGVRFRHCKDIQTLIDRGTFETKTEVPIYGTFVFTMPNEAVKFRPNPELELTPSSVNGHVDVTATIPLGVLNTSIQNYSLGAEFMHHVNNSGITQIQLRGVFFRYPSSNFIFHEAENRIQMDSTNPFESRKKGLKCRIFLDAEFSLASNLEDFEAPLVTDQVPNKYLMNISFRNMLKTLEKPSGYDASLFLHEDGTKFTKQEVLDYVWSEWSWWSPKTVYRKRDFDQITNDNSASIATGFNFDPSSNAAKSFFGKEFTAANYPKGVPAQKFKITDGPVNARTVYYAKIRVRENWSGYNALGLTATPENVVAQQSRPLTPQEASELEVTGSTKPQPTTHIMSPVGECLDFLVPISWYNEVTSDKIEWGNYIQGTHGTDSSPSVTLTPFGLMTWMYQHATGDINTKEFVNNVKQVTSGWTVSDWNERFWDLVNVEFICEEVDSANYKLMDEFGFVTKYAPATGAFVEVESDIGDLDWNVPGLSYLVPNTLGGYYFNIPRNIKPLRDWNEKVNRLELFNYIIPASLYEFESPNKIVLADDIVFDSFSGASFNARTFFDLFFENENYETITDNFSDTRQINWTVYENNELDMYELGVRRPSITTAFGISTDGSSTDPFFDIVTVEGNPSFKRNDESTLAVYDPMRLGNNNSLKTNVREDNNGGFKKTMYFVDSKNEVFDISAQIFFDSQLDNYKNYNGKRFEFILKANSNFNSSASSYNVEEYYFVGIGTFGFDIALGVVRYDFFNNTIQKTFLAGFGDYNTRNVKTSTWYDLKCEVDGDYIKVFFNEDIQAERLVINYNIQPSRKDDANRYINGEFEELVYLISGLDKLDITYPGTLQSKTNSVFYNENWNENYAKSIRPSGPLAGMRIFNDLTYVGDVTYRAKIQDNRIYGDVNDVDDITDIIEKIKVQYNPAGAVTFFSKTLNKTYIILIGTTLFYKLQGKETTFYSSDVDSVQIYKDKVLIKFICNKITFVVEDDDFKFSRNLFIKDASFNTDHIYKYMGFTQRKVNNFWVANSNLHVEFVADDIECNPWGFSVWGDPVWGCFQACLFE